MDVLRLHGAGDIRLHQEPDPEPGPGETLVRVTAVGLCGSDLHWYEDGGIGLDRVVEPFVLGHEMGGVIASGPGEGERVVIEPADPCGHCDACRAGHGNLCPDVRFCGHAPIPGGLSTYMTWPRRLLMPVPDSVTGDHVALLEPLGIALHAIDLGHVRRGMRAGVFGCGPVGQLLIRALRAAGVEHIQATDPLAHRREAALASGADEVGPTTVDGQPDDLATWRPVDVAFEVAGEDAALETALKAVRHGGRVVIVGIPPTDRTSFRAGLAREKGLTLVLSRRMQQRHMLQAIELVDHAAVSLDGLVTSTYPITDGPAAFERLVSRDGMKIVVKPSA